MGLTVARTPATLNTALKSDAALVATTATRLAWWLLRTRRKALGVVATTVPVPVVTTRAAESVTLTVTTAAAAMTELKVMSVLTVAMVVTRVVSALCRRLSLRDVSPMAETTHRSFTVRPALTAVAPCRAF